MMNLTRTLALEYADRGIRVNGIGPGATVTPINSRLDRRPGQEASRSRATSRCAAPARPTRWAAWRASWPATTAAYITGQTIFVDGGLTLYPSFREPWSSE